MKERKCRRKSLDGYDEREREKENNLKELVKTKNVLRSYDARQSHVK